MAVAAPAPVRPSSSVVPPVEWRMLEILGGASGNVTLNTAIAGKNTATYRFVCLHGFPDHSLSWMVFLLPELARALDGDLQMIAPDLRGTNRSVPKFSDWRDYSPDKIAGDVRLLWEQHFARSGTPDFWLLGHDFGAGIAWVSAGLFPSPNMKGVVAMSIPFPQAAVSTPRSTSSSAYRALLARAKLTFVAASSQDFEPMDGMFEGVARFHEVRDAYKEAWRYDNSLLYHLMWYSAAVQLAERGPLPDPPVPALFLFGIDDRVSSGSTRCCQMLFVEELYIGHLNTSHWVFQEDPKGVSRAIVEFVHHTPAPTAYKEVEEYCTEHPEWWSDRIQQLCVERTSTVGNLTAKPEWPMEADLRKLRVLSRHCDAELDGSCPSTAIATNCLTEVLSARCIQTFCDELPALQACLDATGEESSCAVFRTITLFKLARHFFCELEPKDLQDVVLQASTFNVSLPTLSVEMAGKPDLRWARAVGPLLAVAALASFGCCIARNHDEKLGSERSPMVMVDSSDEGL